MKKAAPIAIAAATFLASASSAFAQNINTSADANYLHNFAPPSLSIGTVIAWIVGAAVVFGVIAALLFIVLGAFQWITSGGDKGKVESARNHIVAAIVGLVVIFLSLVIINFVAEILGLGGIFNLQIKPLTNGGGTAVTCTPPQTLQPDGTCR